MVFVMVLLACCGSRCAEAQVHVCVQPLPGEHTTPVLCMHAQLHCLPVWPASNVLAQHHLTAAVFVFRLC